MDQSLVQISYEKMSKSKGNGVSPKSLADEFGVDTLRSAIMFGAPPEHDLQFDKKQVVNTGAYLQKVGKLQVMLKERGGERSMDEMLESVIETAQGDSEVKAVLISVLKLLIDYETKIGKSRFFHVAFARLMELTNTISAIALRQEDEKDGNDLERICVGWLLQGLYPYAPHLTSEMWSELGLNSTGDIQDQNVCNYHEILQTLQTRIPFSLSINGKFAATIEIPPDLQGDAEGIHKYLTENQSEISDICLKGSPKKVLSVIEKPMSSFKRVITRPDKPIVNFIV